MDKTISSRTPEGAPNRCPVCGNSFCVEPSTPPGDAPCPHCGSLAWFGEVVFQSELRPLFCDAYLPELRAINQEQAIREIIAHLASAGKIDQSDEESIVAAILRREELGSTGIGRGFAVPHAKHRSVQHLVVAMALSSRGIEFNSLDGRPAHIVVLLVSPADHGDAHLRTLERVSRWLRGVFRER